MQPEGYLVENRIVVWDIDSSRKLYSKGYFGKPMGIPKPKGIEFERRLVLDRIEIYYIRQRTELVVKTGSLHTASTKSITASCRKLYADFDRKYIVFKDLRHRG